MNQDGSIIPHSKKKEVLPEMHGGPSGGHTGVGKTLDSQAAVLLATFKEQHREMVSTVRHLRSKSRLRTRSRGTFGENCHGHC
jgi:hypothetical protein